MWALYAQRLLALLGHKSHHNSACLLCMPSVFMLAQSSTEQALKYIPQAISNSWISHFPILCHYQVWGDKIPYCFAGLLMQPNIYRRAVTQGPGHTVDTDMHVFKHLLSRLAPAEALLKLYVITWHNSGILGRRSEFTAAVCWTCGNNKQVCAAQCL